jgi:hypothetical protein
MQTPGGAHLVSADHYRINEPDVSAEAFEEEVLVINLSNGHYHSVRGSGVFLWKALTAGLSRREAVDRLVAGRSEDATAVAQAGEFIDRLVGEGLLIAAPDRTDVGPLDLVPPESWVAPSIETFTDMENLLTIDPIHDVDSQGWPHGQGPARG